MVPQPWDRTNLAYNLAGTTTVTVADSISDVLFPSFSRLEPARRGPALIRAVSVMSLVVCPLAFRTAAVSGTLVDAAFPAEWSSIGSMLAVLSIFSACHPLRLPYIVFYKSQGRTIFIMTAGFFRLGLLCVLVPRRAPGAFVGMCSGVHHVLRLAPDVGRAAIGAPANCFGRLPAGCSCLCSPAFRWCLPSAPLRLLHRLSD